MERDPESEYTILVTTPYGMKIGNMTLLQSETKGIIFVTTSAYFPHNEPQDFILSDFYDSYNKYDVIDFHHDEDYDTDIEDIIMLNIEKSKHIKILKWPKIKQEINFKYKQISEDNYLLLQTQRYNWYGYNKPSPKCANMFQFFWDYLRI